MSSSPDPATAAASIATPSSASSLMDKGLIGPPRRKKRFAPLDPEKRGRDGELPELKGVIFDMDGTLCEAQTYMFAEMRAALSIPKSVDILTHIDSLPHPTAQRTAFAAIEAIESRAMLSQTPSPGMAQLFRYLPTRDIHRKAILTRNFTRPVEHLLSTHMGEFKDGIDPVLTREFLPPKPRPEGIWEIARQWALDDGDGEMGAEGLIMVGDSIDDMAAGRHAGAATVLLVTPVNHEMREHEYTDLAIERLDDLITILDEGFVGRGGEN